MSTLALCRKRHHNRPYSRCEWSEESRQVSTTLTIGIEGGSSETVNLASLQDGVGSDNQSISGSGLSGTTLTIGISGGSSETVNLSSLQGSTVSSINDLSDALVEDDSMYLGNNPSSTTSTAEYNVAIGMTALKSVTTGFANVALGHEALTADTSGWGNTAVGYDSLSTNIVGRNNTAVGYNASKTSNEHANSALGAFALEDSTSGIGNTAIGYEALKENITGSNNVALGSAALDTNTTGGDNTAIGAAADVASNNLTNATAIGSGASVAASNTIQLGNTSVTNVKTSGSVTTGAITIPNTDGSADQVLKTDGSGVLSWGAAFDTSQLQLVTATGTNGSVTATCPGTKKLIFGSCNRSTGFPGTSGNYEFRDEPNSGLTSFTCYSGSSRTSFQKAHAVCY